jgi:hypothetical protein
MRITILSSNRAKCTDFFLFISLITHKCDNCVVYLHIHISTSFLVYLYLLYVNVYLQQLFSVCTSLYGTDNNNWAFIESTKLEPTYMER